MGGKGLALLVGLGCGLCCLAQEPDRPEFHDPGFKFNIGPAGEYVARVVFDDGSPPPVSVQVQSTCHNFQVMGDGTVRYVDPGPIPCSVTVSLAGFVTVRAARPRGLLILHRRGYEGGSMISVNAAVLRCPPRAGEAYGRGEAALGSGDAATAEKWLRAATEACPAHSLAWDELGVILQLSNRVEEARAAYGTALAKEPRSARALTHLAGLAIQESHPAVALELCERAIRLKPAGLPRLWYYHGLAAYQAGQFPIAESSLKRAIEEDQRHLFPLSEFLLGMIFARTGDIAKARTHLRAYLALEPGSREAAQARLVMERAGAR